MVSLDTHLLLGDFFYTVLLVAFILATTLLLNVLPKEVDRAMNVNGADEGDKLEVELLGAEREQERTVAEDLLQVCRDGALNKVVGVFNRLLKV